MKVKELKELIKNLSDETELLLQDDDEGNGYRKLEGIDSHAICLELDNYNIEKVYDDRWSALDAGCDEDEWEEIIY